MKRRWAAEACFDILGHQVLLRSTSLEFARYAGQLLRCFGATTENGRMPDLVFSIVDAPAIGLPTHQPLYSLFRNEDHVGQTDEFWQLFRLMEWQLDIYLAAAVKDRYLLHAGAVAKDGVGLILPGASGQGKSSMTMTLLLQGFRYLSDELAVIDPATALLRAFPKPFSLKDPSIFTDLGRRREIWLGLQAENRQASEDSVPVWYVHPEDVQPGCVEHGAMPIHFIIFPKFDRDTAPALQPLTPSESLHKLLDNSVNFHQLSRGGLRLLAQLVQEANSFTLTTNGIPATIEYVGQLL